MVGKIVSNSFQIIRSRWTDFTNLINLEFGQFYFSNHWINWNYNSLRSVAYHSKHFKRKLWSFSFFYVLFDYFFWIFIFKGEMCKRRLSFQAKCVYLPWNCFHVVKKCLFCLFILGFSLKKHSQNKKNLCVAQFYQ